uniref:Cerebral peptide 1 n=1 Tax=Magallana gigas TaxID=29159 RepID=K1RVY5_MAGGI
MESPSLYLIVIALVLGIVSTDEELIDKRRPGWGKRGSLDFGSNNLPNSIIEKRKPGWGKRGMEDEFEMNKRKPGWGKRAPGWGKRSFNEDLNNFIEKRRPGWGKRTSDLMDALNAMEVNKRKPGWGKRSEMEKRKPGWGKRTVPELSETDLSYSSIPTDSFSVLDKRRPGWGKSWRNITDLTAEDNHLRHQILATQSGKNKGVIHYWNSGSFRQSSESRLSPKGIGYTKNDEPDRFYTTTSVNDPACDMQGFNLVILPDPRKSSTEIFMSPRVWVLTLGQGQMDV